MKASTGVQDSLASELGLHLGRTFRLNRGVLLTPYIKAAWEHEYIDNNSTIINGRNTFTTDLSGDTGKVGLGMDVSFNKALSLFAELDYAKGDRQEEPARASLGLRYSF